MKNSKGITHLYIVLAVVVVVFVFVFGKNYKNSNFANFSFIRGENTVPEDKPEKGLVYKGLERDQEKCKGGFKFNVKGEDKCTHGPDEVPTDTNLSMAQIVSPGSGNSNGVTTTTVTCDGDGVSGDRVEVLYVRGSDVASKYDTYLTSFQTWVSGVDADFANSAIRSGGSAIHPRFVHDSACRPVIKEVVIPATGQVNFAVTQSQLRDLGYSATNRKYLIFMDNTTYCGISDVAYDDKLSPLNFNNNGPFYSRVDNNCWADITAAHELMHALGGVQVSAPHSSFEWHCTDIADVMCRPTNGTPTQLVCGTGSNEEYQAQNNLFDCNHDDYFSAKVTDPNNYLATHWNAASSKFLINPYPFPSKIDQLQLFKKSGKNLVAATFYTTSDKAAIAKVRAVEGGGSAAVGTSGVSVTLTLSDPSGVQKSTVSGTTDASGYYQGNLNFVTRTIGNWTVRVVSATKSGVNYLSDPTSVSQIQVNRVK